LCRLYVTAEQLPEKLMMRHSKERSDEKSLFLREQIQEGFLAPLGKTALGAFSATREAVTHKHPRD
jgi:hypothetical protein